METTIHPWIWMFLLPGAILFTLILIGWVVKRLLDLNNNDDIDIGY